MASRPRGILGQAKGAEAPLPSRVWGRIPAHKNLIPCHLPVSDYSSPVPIVKLKHPPSDRHQSFVSAPDDGLPASTPTDLSDYSSPKPIVKLKHPLSNHHQPFASKCATDDGLSTSTPTDNQDLQEICRAEFLVSGIPSRDSHLPATP